MTPFLSLGIAALASLPSTPAQAAVSATPAAPAQVRVVRPVEPAVPMEEIEEIEPARPIAPQASDEDRGVIGIYLGSNDAADSSGARVNGLVEGGAADAAGLREGDRILAIDDVPVPNVGALLGAMQGRKSGERVSLTVERDGWRKHIELELGAARAPRPVERIDSVEERREAAERMERAERARRAEDQESEEIAKLRELIELHAAESDHDANVWIEVEEEHEAHHGDSDRERKVREWIEVREQGGDRHIERRAWINGEEVSPEELDRLDLFEGVPHAHGEGTDREPRRSEWRIIELDGEQDIEWPRDADGRLRGEGRVRGLNLRSRRTVAPHTPPEPAAPRAELRELREEIHALREELRELRTELRRLRRDR